MKALLKNFKLLACVLIGWLLLAPMVLAAGRTYVVAIGISDYKYPEICPTLGGHTLTSARTAANFFHKYNGGNVFMLLDSNATRDHMLRVMKSQFSKADKDDIIILIFSGHGFPGGITTYGFDGKNDRGVSYAEVQSIMRQSKASRKVIFAEACYSGGFSKSNGQQNNGQNNRHNRGQRYDGKDITEVMLYMSSRADEVSYVPCFMHFVIEGLSGSADANNDRKVTCRELFNYVNAAVIDDTDNAQHPQMWGRFDNNMVITSY